MGDAQSGRAYDSLMVECAKHINEIEGDLYSNCRASGNI
jgi:hypothetical protein